jgi:UDP-N-acetylmuramoyl-tripeptide--D-alanyl-D-alanine ligase
VRALCADGVAVLNGDDAHVGVWRDAAGAGVRIALFALDHASAVHGAFRSLPEGGTLELATAEGSATVRMQAPGRHNAGNALAASAAALAIGVPLPAVVCGLESFRPVAGRLVARRARDGALIIDDTYNANPDSVRAAIDVLGGMPGAKWLALGDMGEVGAQGPAFHREIGAYARRAGIDRLFTVGTLSTDAAAAFGPEAEHHASVESLAERLAQAAGSGTTLLVKGSRFMRMERIVAALSGEAQAGGPR